MPQKVEPNKTRLVPGFNLMRFLGDIRTRTAYITIEKLLFSSTISTKGAQLFFCDKNNST